MTKVSVVMPCRNEAASVGACIEKVKKALQNTGMQGEIIVVDNNSTDDSKKVAEEAGAKIVSQPINGYGASCIAGLSAANGDYIVLADADNTYDFLEMHKFTRSLDEGNDFVVGSRFRGKMEKGSMRPLHKFIGNPFLNFVFNFLFGTNFTDTHCGFRAITKNAFERLELKQEGMEFALELIVKAKKKNFRMDEVPVNYYRRIGPSNMRSFRDGMRHLLFMFSEFAK